MLFNKWNHSLWDMYEHKVSTSGPNEGGFHRTIASGTVLEDGIGTIESDAFTLGVLVPTLVPKPSTLVTDVEVRPSCARRGVAPPIVRDSAL